MAAEEERKRHIPFALNKNFLVLMVVFSAIIVLALTAGTFTALNAAETQSEQTQSLLLTALDLQMTTTESSFTEHAMEDEAAELVESPEVVILASADGLGDVTVPLTDEESAALNALEAYLATYSANSYQGTNIYYIYFSNTDYLIDPAYPAQNARSADNDLYLEGIDSYIDEETPGMYAHWLGTLPDGTPYAGVVKILIPGVYFVDINTQRMMFSYSFSDSLLEALAGADAESYSYDQFGNEHAQGDTTELAGVFTYESLGTEPSGSFCFEFDGHPYIGAYCTFASRGTRFAVFARDVATENMNTLRMVMGITDGVFLIIGLGAAFLLIRRTFKPLDDLMPSLASREERDSFHDDVGIITRTIDSWGSRLASQEALLHDSWLLHLLRGSDTSRFDEYQDRWLAEAHGKTFVLVGLKPDPSDDGTVPDGGSFAIQAADHLCETGFPTQLVSDGDLYLLIADIDEKGYTGLITELGSLQQNTGHMTMSFYISTPCTSMRELQRGYNEVSFIADHCLSMEIYGALIEYPDVAGFRKPTTSSMPSFEELKRLCDCIASLSRREALTQYDELVTELTTNGETNEINSLVFNLLKNAIALAFCDVILPDNADGSNTLRLIEAIRAAEDPTALRDEFNAALKILDTSDNQQDYDQRRFEEIRTYIQANYHDPNLSSKAVADQFGISMSGITKLFKRYNHSGFLEYVHHLRVSEAMKLLRETDMGEAEIATLVGYNNLITMIRAFKKYAHATPSAIRMGSAL